MHHLPLFALLPLMACISLLPAGDSAPFGDKVQLRDGLDRALAQFASAKTGNVAFIGGSITEMDGYRPMVMNLLRKRFPATAFTFTNAGIASTCSTTGAFRLERDVLSKGRIDLLFVEFAVNDDQDAGHPREVCIRGLEGIIRHARNSNPSMDIVVTYFVNQGMLKTIAQGKVPLTIEAHGAVAQHYGVPAINLAQEVSERITAKTFSWEAYGGVHPAPAGNQICADMIDELFARAGASPVPAKPPVRKLPEPLDPLNYEAGRFIDHAQATIVSGWTVGVPDWKSLPGQKRDRFTSIPMLHASEAGAKLTLEFTGTAVGAFIVAGPDAGIAEVRIDGGPVAKVGLMAGYSKTLHYPRTVLLGSGLKPGKHVLELTMSAESKGGGHAMRIVSLVAN